MKFRMPLVMVLILTFVGFIAANALQEECAAKCRECYKEAMDRMYCTTECIHNGDITCPTTALSPKAEVQAFNTLWASYMNTENDTALRAMHTDDASYFIVTDLVQFGFGVSALIEAYDDWHFGNTNLVRMDSPVEVAAKGSGLVIGYGPLHFYDNEDKVAFSYKRVYVYKREQGKLLGYLDIIWEETNQNN